MALHKKLPQGVQAIDPVWSRVRNEAEECARREPALASFIFTTVLNHNSLEHAVAHRVAARLGSSDVSSELIAQAFREAIEAELVIGAAMRADIIAVAERDPATSRYLEPVLYYKGFHALQAHRLTRIIFGIAGARTSRCISRVSRLRCSASTSTRIRRSAKASSSIMRPAW